MAQWLAGGLYSGVRADGRGSLDFRVRVCQMGFFLHVNGSSRVTVAPLGGASHRVDVLCTVCAEAGEPEADAPGRGRMEFSVTIADRSDATMGKFARQTWRRSCHRPCREALHLCLVRRASVTLCCC